MPKVKVPRKNISIDMTAMCDVSFLLLTFFMLTSNFTVKEPVLVSTPASISEIKIPERNIAQIIIDNDGKVFFGMDGQQHRKDLLEKVGDLYNIQFSKEELNKFSLINSFGIPIDKMKSYLAIDPLYRDNPENQLGIPTDSINNQFSNWVKVARSINRDIIIAIKADRNTPYKVIKNVMGTMQKLNENRYHLITSLATGKEGAEKILK